MCNIQYKPNLILKNDSSNQESFVSAKKKLFKFYFTLAVKVIDNDIKTNYC